jgi:DNA repair exonuclease SbcCD ATPase subunit
LRIDYLKLENYAGIAHGTGLTEIELDFSAGNRFIMLVGKNGSGKTTILSAFHPFAGTYDSRPTPITPGKEGRKVVRISHDGSTYEVQHFYGKRAVKSFISKDGVELNENGGVTTFKDLVLTELGLDEDYFKIGRIGSNVSSFTDLTTAKRKEFISNFLPEIDDYLTCHKNANARFNLVKKEVATISDQLKRIDTLEALQSLLEADTGRLTAFETDIQAASEEKARNHGRSQQISADMVPLRAASADFVAYAKVHAKASATVSALGAKHPKLAALSVAEVRSMLAATNEAQAATVATLDSVKVRLQDALVESARRVNAKKSKKDQLAKLGRTDETAEEIDQLVASLSERVAYAASELAALKAKGFPDLSGIPSKDVLTAKGLLKELSDYLLLTLRGDGGQDVRSFFVVELESGTLSAASIASMVHESREASKAAIAKCVAIREEIAGLKGNLGQLEILKKRPAECRMDHCAFISNALQYKDLPLTIKGKEIELQRAEEAAASLGDDLESCLGMQKIYEAFKQYALRASKYDMLQRIPGLYESLSTAKAIAGLLWKPEAEIEDYLDLGRAHRAAVLAEALAESEEKVKIAKERLEMVRSQQDTIDSIRNELKDLETSCTEADQLADQLAEEEKALVDKHAKATLRIEVLGTFLSAMEEMQTTTSTLAALESDNNRFSDLSAQLKLATSEAEKAEKRAADLTREKAPLVKRIDDVKLRIAKREELEQRIASLEDSYKTLDLIRRSLDPAKGIPLFFIDGYLKRTKRICNELLSLAYGDRFRVSDFVISDKEFKIQVRKQDAGILDDVLHASQGERALVTISLSLALIEQAISKYNILCLDEMDGPLDADNRSAFVEMLDTQARKLGIEQVLLISHNENFFGQPIDLVLLDGANVDATSVPDARVVFGG